MLSVNSMSLVIVESPTKARTLGKFLGKEYHIEATMGHIRDLPQKKLGIDIEKAANNSHFEFKPRYEVIPDRKKNITILKKEAIKDHNIILATDPDREGEAIAFHIKAIFINDKNIKKINPQFKRIVFHEITKSAIEHALTDSREIDDKLVSAQQTRRLLDRLVGYKLSPLLWNKLGKRWLSAGRVQSVCVRLIVEREREIKAFVPVEYWLIEADLEAKKGKFIAKLAQIDGKKAEVGNQEQADGLINKLDQSKYSVANVEIKDVRRYPSSPFITSTLQQAASNRFGWSAKKTMRAAQQLYEEGLITYHRTDSTNLAKEAIFSVRSFIEKYLGREYLPNEAKFYKTKSKVAQEAHEAIRVTNPQLISQADQKIIKITENTKLFPEELGREAQLLYSLIWKRFLACQMNEAVFEATSISVCADYNKDGQTNNYLFRASGQKIKFDGFLKVYERRQAEDDENIELPRVEINELLKLNKIIPSQKFTEPPPRFNEASLIKTLEELGIGRPSTYAPIISTIQDRKYVEKIEKRFFPTDLGFAVNDFLIKHFPKIFEVTFTAGMEDELDEIANGKLEQDKVLNDFYVPFKTRLDEVFKDADRVKVDLGTTDEKCPECGKPLAIKMSRYGKFLACSGFPECKFTKNILNKTGIICPKCGGDIVMKRTRRGKQFYGCANYPKCDFAAWKKEDIK